MVFKGIFNDEEEWRFRVKHINQQPILERNDGGDVPMYSSNKVRGGKIFRDQESFERNLKEWLQLT